MMVVVAQAGGQTTASYTVYLNSNGCPKRADTHIQYGGIG
jgi:hypothetical protein